MTLIVVHTTNNRLGRCDSRCYNVHEPNCECICGGANHGAGLAQATENTRQYAKAMLEKYVGSKELVKFRAELGHAVEQWPLL